MKKLFFPLIVLLFYFTSVYPQSSLNLLDDALHYRGLNRNDITIPLDFFNTAEKSPTASTRLILPITARLLNNPLQCFEWLDSFTVMENNDLKFMLKKFFEILCCNISNNNISYFSTNGNTDWTYEITKQIFLLDKNSHNLLFNFSNTEYRYLTENFFSILDESDNDDLSNFDIFKFNIQRDSSINKSKRVMDLLSKLDINKIYANSYNDFAFFYSLYDSLKLNVDYNQKLGYLRNEDIIIKHNNVKILISAGNNNNTYTVKDFQQYNLIIDFGGNDIYNFENKNKFSKNNLKCIIDLSGNDHYTTSSSFTLAGGLFSSSFIFDKEGDDVYESREAGNFGAAVGGIGLLYDENGNDTYRSLSFSIGAGCLGIGLLVDKNGNDVYIANSYSQGFGMTQGVGAILDSKGNDSYLVDSRSLDIGRYNDHYVSMCQGFGLGLRPYYAGGVGLIIEGEGNDIYSTDIFGQGSGYWYSIGAIIDKSGHDKYNSYQYAQGSGVHIAIGLLKDEDGWDFYSSNGVSQGCGHDYGFGLLWDVRGFDNYSAYSLSQGAGNANGIGILLDESGRDGYLNKEPVNTRGYGNPRREFGSLGIFIDASGSDFYSVTGLDSTIENNSLWGVFSDYTATDLPEQNNGSNFKVPVDSVNYQQGMPFTTEQYYIMAKTIEPRFSLWQEYGFRNLITDSINTAYYTMTQLGTDDHRIVQVMRVLIQKIPHIISEAIIAKYSSEKEKLTPDELSMICYLAGESKNPALKNVMYELTFNESKRVRSTAVNALGKLKIDTSDYEFISRVSSRLNELISDTNITKLMKKDIAFAYKNYKLENNISSVFKLLQCDYYGARFIAAEVLKSYKDYYYTYINNNFTIDITQNYAVLHAFLNSLGGLSDNSFMNILDKLTANNYDEIDKLKFIEIIKMRQNTATDENIKMWCREKIKMLPQGVSLKVK